MPNPPPSTPQTTKGFIRAFGAIELIGDAIMAYFGAGWDVSGLIPVRWFAYAVISFGAFMEINPERFLQRSADFQNIPLKSSNKRR